LIPLAIALDSVEAAQRSSTRARERVPKDQMMLPPMNRPNDPSPAAEKPEPLAAAAEALKRAEDAMRAKRTGEAAGICQDVLETVPDYPPALALLGTITAHRGNVEQGIALLARACGLAPGNPGWFLNLATLCRVACRFDEAQAAMQKAMKLAPDNTNLLLNLGKLQVDRGEHQAALQSLLNVLAREPQNAEAHLAIGQIQLMHGETRSGWLEYEWRNQLDQAKGTIPKMPRPQWNGMKLPNDAILLIGDQGYGDSLQFARFIPHVAERCARVLLGCAPDLAGLLGPIPGVHECYTTWRGIPAHAVYCRLSSVPALLDIGMDQLPGTIPYIVPDPEAVAAWGERLDERLGRKTRPRVGLVWAGRPNHPNDRRRSVRLAQMAPITGLEGVSLVSLQKVVPRRDAAAFAALDVLDVAAELTDYSATAALIANLDLVVTIDSSVAHLAGAMGRSVWVLVPRPSDWRWMLDRTDSPWYPSMRLFRQPTPGDWTACIAAAAEALAEFASGFHDAPIQMYRARAAGLNRRRTVTGVAEAQARNA
jgi:tetratricopeptide (TPR) repeat protein